VKDACATALKGLCLAQEIVRVAEVKRLQRTFVTRSLTDLKPSDDFLTVRRKTGSMGTGFPEPSHCGLPMS